MLISLQTKAQAFVVLDAFEQDLRFCLGAYLLDHLSAESVLGEAYTEVHARAVKDDVSDDSTISDYLYLRQVYDLLLRFADKLPRDLGDELRANAPALDELVSVRNRVMHGRPLQIDDLESAAGFISRFVSRYFTVTREVRDVLRREPLWDPPYSPSQAPHERVLHNLPMADFDETGLVGRGSEAKEVREWLERRRDRIITITGEGGIGKTALALQIAYGFVDELEPQFDCVLWVSLKNEILTADGVQRLSGAIRDIAGASTELGRAFDADFEGSIDELADYLEGLNALIVIDNLETAEGREVLALYDALPATTSFLFTSRVGLGQVERRYSLGGLAQGDAELLLRKFASRRRVGIVASATKEKAAETVHNLRYSPLAIRWYVLSVEAGSTPTDTTRNQDELLRFCVDNVYEGLSAGAKLLLVILRSLDRPITFDELAVVAALPIDELREHSQALSRGSLVVRQKATAEGEDETLQISATARAYLPRVDYASSMLQGVAAREAAYLADREKQQLEAQARRLDANIVHTRGKEDEPTAHLLRLALRFSKNEDFDRAIAQIERARGLNPTFFEVDRIHAFILASHNDTYQAELQYRQALSAALGDRQKAIVSYFYGGFLSRQQRDLPGALLKAQFAHDTLDYPDTALLLGNVYVWSQRFAEGQEYLEQALDAPSVKMRRIVTTALIESWKRWAEFALESRNPLETYDKAISGASIGHQFISSGNQDQKLAGSVLEAIRLAARARQLVADDHLADPKKLTKELVFVSEWISIFRTTRDWDRFTGRIRELMRAENVDAELKAAAALVTQADSRRQQRDRFADSATSTTLVLRGQIINLHPTYGFISHQMYPQGVFFHFGSLRAGQDKTSLVVGDTVEFELEVQPDGKNRAVDVGSL